MLVTAGPLGESEIQLGASSIEGVIQSAGKRYTIYKHCLTQRATGGTLISSNNGDAGFCNTESEPVSKK